MFGRKKISSLEDEVSHLKSKIKGQVERVNEAVETERKVIKWAEKLKSDAEKIARERDDLRNKVREQTDNDIAISSLKILGVIPTEKKPTRDDMDRLLAQRQWSAAQQSQLSQSPLGGYGAGGMKGCFSGLTGRFL